MRLPFSSIQTRRVNLAGLFSLCGMAGLGFARQAIAQDVPSPLRPNFSGRWRMDKDKSTFAGFSPPDTIVRQVDHHEPTLNVHTTQTKDGRSSSADVSYFTDGTESTNTINGHDAICKGFWDGPALVVRTTAKDSHGKDIVYEDRWELSEDKQTLTNESHITTAKGEVIMKLVSQKEEK